MVNLAMGELDIAFRHLLRVLQLAFPKHPLEWLGELDSSVDRPR
jgi:hypothetical protein